MNLSEEQKALIDDVRRGGNVFVTGPAGTGKSLLLRELRDIIGRDLSVTGSTGISAVNVGGITLHSWAGIGRAEDAADLIIGKIIKAKAKGYWRIKTAKVLAIDEISMIPASILDLIDQVFRAVRRRNQPFGGIQVIFFGDFLQMPPVETKTVASGFAFKSPVWSTVRTHQLTRIFRQENVEFAAALNEIRFGVLGDKTRAILNQRFNAKDEDPEFEAVTIHTHNEDVERINLERLNQLPGPEGLFVSEDYGDNEYAINAMDKSCLAPKNLRIKVDAQVMLLKNMDVKAGLCNGSIGKVVKITNGIGIKAEFIDNGQRVPLWLETHCWEQKDGDHVVASRKQFPIRLAWALTAHKTQGMTLDKVRVHLGKVFEYGQAYVALSRSKTKEGLFIADGGRGSIRAHPEAVRFYREGENV